MTLRRLTLAGGLAVVLGGGAPALSAQYESRAPVVRPRTPVVEQHVYPPTPVCFEEWPTYWEDPVAYGDRRLHRRREEGLPPELRTPPPEGVRVECVQSGFAPLASLGSAAGEPFTPPAVGRRARWSELQRLRQEAWWEATRRREAGVPPVSVRLHTEPGLAAPPTAAAPSGEGYPTRAEAAAAVTGAVRSEDPRFGPAERRGASRLRSEGASRAAGGTPFGAEASVRIRERSRRTDVRRHLEPAPPPSIALPSGRFDPSIRATPEFRAMERILRSSELDSFARWIWELSRGLGPGQAGDPYTRVDPEAVERWLESPEGRQAGSRALDMLDGTMELMHELWGFSRDRIERSLEEGAGG